MEQLYLRGSVKQLLQTHYKLASKKVKLLTKLDYKRNIVYFYETFNKNNFIYIYIYIYMCSLEEFIIMNYESSQNQARELLLESSLVVNMREYLGIHIVEKQ